MNQTVTFKIGFKPINLFAVPAFILFCLLMVGNLNAQNVTVAGAVAGNGTYADLGSAFTAINGDPQAGATITVSIVGNTTEAASAILNQGAWTSLTISPSGGAARTISGAITGVLVDLNGADNVTIDGLNTGGNSLIIENTATGASNTIRFINDASNNTITKCTLKGAASTLQNGVVFFSTGTTTGNDNNNINNCDITGSGANLPINGIYAQGTSAAIDNSGNTINANNIYDFFSAGSTSIGLHLNATGTGNSAWTITNNKIYQTATRTYTTANTHQGIFVGSGTGYTISGNQIGAADAAGTGTYTMTGTIATRFIGIGMSLTAGAPASSVQGNTVYSLALTTSSGASATNGIICGINVTAGNVDIGTVTGNTIGSMSGTGSIVATPSTTQGAIVGINCSSTGTINISNNQMGAWSSSGATAAVAGGVIGITISGAGTSMTINNNTIGNTTANNMKAGVLGTTTGSSVGGGINLSGTPVLAIITNNTIQNFSTYGTGTGGFVRGIYTTTSSSAAATGWMVSNNVITNLTTTGALTSLSSGLTSVAGIHMLSPTGVDIFQNTISNLSNANIAATTNTVVAGIVSANSLTAGAGHNIYRNKIWNLSNAGVGTAATTPPVVTGIAVRSGNAATTIANNMITLGTGQTTNTSFIGIWSNNGSTPNPTSTNVYFNSVQIEGTAASGALPSFGFLRAQYNSTTSNTVTVDVRNNIFQNVRTGGTGQHFAISNGYNVTTVSATGWASNYNVLSANAATIGHWTSAQTFAGWQAASAGDANSISGSTINFVNTATGDLHIQFPPASVVESAGINIPSVTVDFDGQTRNSFSPVDIGADAGDFTNAPSISLTPLGTTCATGARTLTASISDIDGVPTSGIGLPVLYWKINGGAYSAATATFVSGSNYNFSFGAGAVIGDVVSYYVVAQDNLDNVGSSPLLGAAGFTANPPAVSTPPTSPYTYVISQTLTGTYTVGAAGDYSTLTAAVNAYNSACLGGPVVFSLTDATYPSETFPININANPDASAVNTLTIKPAVAASISGSSTTGMIQINGGDYVTIDGSIGNTANTICPASAATRDLTITNTSATATSAVVWLGTTGTGNAVTNCTVKNCVLVGNAPTTTIVGLGAGGPTIGIGGTNNDNISFINNDIRACQFGIYSAGAGAANKNQNLTINQNVIASATPNNVLQGGIYVATTNNVTISGNTIDNIVNPNTSQDPMGINVGFGAVNGLTATATGIADGVTNVTITNNTIGVVTNNATYSAAGIALGNTISGTSLIANNTVSGVASNGTAGDYASGIVLGGGAGTVNVYHNTVLMQGTVSGATAASVASTCFSITASTVPNNVDIKNNIFVNTQVGNASATLRLLAVGLGYAAPYTGFLSNNNNLFSAGAGPGTYAIGATGGIAAGTLRTTLADWQTETVQDANSKNVSPVFVSGTNLHLVAADPANATLLCGGTQTLSAPTDIDCQDRKITSTIGADEIPVSITANISVSETSGTANDGNICAGASVGLTASGGATYAWSTGENMAAISVTPAGTTTYTVTVTDAGGCATATSTTITVNPAPTSGITIAETSGTTNNDGQICAGASASLTGTGGTSYAWNTGDNTATINVTPASTTTYTVTVTNAGGCTATATTTITVNPLPTPGITITETSGTTNNDGIICAGATATLTGTGGTSYAWSNGINTAANPVTPASTTTYTVTVTNANGCTATATTTITVNPLPTAGTTVAETSGTTPNDGTICASASATITGTGGTSYAWNTGDNTAAITVSPASTTTYTVTVTNANGCTATATQTITVNPNPNYTPTVTNPSSCSAANGSISITTTAGTAPFTFNWSTANGCGLINGNQNQTNICPGTYNLTITDASGCSVTGVFALDGPSPGCFSCPTVGTLAASLNPVCQSTNTMLGATGLSGMGATYGIEFKYFTSATTMPYVGGTTIATVPNASLTGGGSIASTTTSFATAGTYFVYAILSPAPTDVNCRPSATTTITVNAVPNTPIAVTETSGTANNDGVICAGANAVLTASGGVNYSWDTGSNSSAISVSPASTTTYTVTVTSAAGCTAIFTSTVTVNPVPVVNLTIAETSGTINNDGVICAGASATITATGGGTYFWSTGFSGGAVHTVTPASTTTYTVTVTNANNCTTIATTTITVNPLPTPAIAVTETSGTTNNDGQICAGASATLTASGGGTYAWSNGINIAANPVTPASTTTYTVTVTSANGCTATSSSTITVNPLPTPATTVAETSGTVSNDGIICAGASATITATGGGTYAWSTGVNTAAITVTPASTTTYTVTVTSAAGCTATSTRTITVNPLPTPAIAVTETSGATPNDAIICNGASATLTASGGTSYAWTTGATSAAILVAPAATTTYTVTVTNANGCTATSSATITVAPPSTLFTVTGGGGFCQGSSTVPVGLSGSQVGFNYQLQINAVNNGAPVAGTGAALNFGNFNTVGTYTVIAINVATTCTTPMSGSVTVFSFNCTPTISDPCVCLNNATTLTNGQFGEQIKVNAPSNQTWTVSAVTGLYTVSSPAPPAAPIAITVGTVLTNIGGNMFTLDGRHIDAIGYTISVTNGAGTTLSIGNSCQYPNPSITSDLTGPFCLYSAPVTLTGNPGDGSVTSQTFTVNGTTTTTFDPGAGVGQYTIVYTVNGGTPKATGPNDPGCIQSVSQIVNVVATPATISCNDLVYVSLDVDCVTEILPDDILEGTYGCDDDYLVELDKTVPYGNGPWVPATVGISDVGQTYQVRITHLVSNNHCWGNVKIEDKLEPVIECTDIDLSCPITTYDPAYLLNTLNIADAYPDVTECSAYTLSYVDTWHDLACNQGFNGVSDLSAYVARKWTAKDAWNNTSTCIQYIYFHRVHVGDVDFPADYVINCGGNINTDPSVTGTPYYTDFGINWHLFPDPGFCELQAAYTDQILPVCDGSYKILRTWTLVDWCLPTTPFPPSQNPQYYIQLIKVLDSQGPAMVCPANLTVSTDPYNCCATTNLPDVIIEDNCSRVNNIGAMVTTFDPYTGDQTGMYTVDGALMTFPGNNYWDLDTLGNWGWTPCLPVGRQTVVYTAEDDCGNTATCSFRLTVADWQPPVAACDQYTVVAIGTDDVSDCYNPIDGCDGAGVTWIHAKTFDDGSTDNCNGLHFTIRRMDPYSDCINGLEDCEKPTATEEQDSIKFYCCEVGTTQTVILRVYQVDQDGAIMNGQDGTPLYNECMVNVEVQDKIKPVCVPPANVTVACENFDASLWVYGKATVYDNCCLDTTKVYQGQCGLSHSANYNLFDTVCSKGTITRTFKAYDCHGLTSQCTQRVVVQYNQDYFVKFPNDVIVTVCDGTGNYGEPSFFGEDCELLGVSYEDQVFTVVPDACFKIERVWTIINWCTYNPNLPCIEVPNPNPNATTNNPANLPGPIVSRAGTLAPWAPTVVKINPTDATATNYSTFWQKEANCYKYKQIIKVIDTQDPVVENCPASPVEVCDITPNDPLLWNESYWWDNLIGQHDLCEGPTDLTITATDACSAANINFRYLLFLDLDNDGTMETVINSVNTGIAGLGWNAVPFGNGANANYTGGTIRAFDGRPVPFNQKYGFAIQTTTSGTKKTAAVRWNTQQSQSNYVIPELPYGTHKIKWFVEDGCGNESVCEYTFIVKDCKKPTVVCLNGLSVNIMPTQMIQLWASDFLKYTEDNCTPADQLKIAIRKSGTGTGFPVDGNGNPITNVTFTCDELGTQLVELWSIDKAGNADFCETYVIVQDNNGNCPNVNAAKVAGALATEATNGLEEGSVQIAGSSNAVPSFNFTTMSDNAGNYNFNAIPLASNSTVTPAKDDNPLNGVSTYDLVLISKHILGIEALNTPYKMIAADANKSGSITTFDIVELRKLILGIYSELPTNTSWRFVDKSFNFPNTANPFQTQFAESKAIQNLAVDQVNEDFVSVKVGDVNGTAIANSLMSSDDRAAGTLLFDVNDQTVRASETFTVTLTPAQASEGYQFTLNTNGLEVVDIAGLKGENYAVFAGATTFSVDGNQAQAPITLTLKATKAGKVSELLSISSRITKAEAYNNGARQDVAFRFNNGGVQTISGVGFELYQNQPNPFVNKTFVGFHLPEATTATLSIYDETGRTVFTQNGNFAKGYNTITIDRALLNTTGMLYYKLETATDSATKKMIQSK